MASKAVWVMGTGVVAAAMIEGAVADMGLRPRVGEHRDTEERSWEGKDALERHEESVAKMVAFGMNCGWVLRGQRVGCMTHDLG